MTCEIISTGASHGNAVLLSGALLFDCGVSYGRIRPYAEQLRLVFLTHVHGDHFNPMTIRRLHRARPRLRFVCGQNLLVPLATRAGVKLDNIIPVPTDGSSLTLHWVEPWDSIEVTAFPLLHDVENVGYIVRLSGGEEDGSAMYATDTHHIPQAAPGLDLYMIEANYREAEMAERMAQKEALGEFSYEYRAAQSHMSMETAMDYLRANADPEKSKIVFLHGHLEKERDENGLDRTASDPPGA